MASGIPSTVFPAPYDFGQLGALDSICQSPHTQNAKKEASSELNSMPPYLRNAIYKHVSICAEQKDGGDPQFGEHHALDDLNRLAAAVRSYAIELSDSPTENNTQSLLSNLSALNTNQVFGPLDIDTFVMVARYLDANTLGSLAAVCKTFRDTILTNEHIWAQFHEREGIPQVQGFPGEVRNYRRDYFTLLPLTCGRKVIEETLPLKMVGPIPKIRREVFARLYDQDPFEAGVPIGQNFVFMVVPGLVKTEDGQVMQFALELLRGLRYDLPQGGSAPVFDQYSNNAVFEQCARGSDKTRVILMRKQVPDQSRNKAFDVQERLVGEHQMQVIDLLSRGLFDLIEICRTGTCPDAQVPRWTYTGCSDPVIINGRRYQSTIGGFAPGAGVCVYGGYDDDDVGVAPGVPAEVLPAIGP